MCEAHAFLLKDGQEELVLENVDIVDIEEDTIRLENIFGEQKILKAKFKAYFNGERKILLESL